MTITLKNTFPNIRVCSFSKVKQKKSSHFSWTYIDCDIVADVSLVFVYTECIIRIIPLSDKFSFKNNMYKEIRITEPTSIVEKSFENKQLAIKLEAVHELHWIRM